MSQFKSPKRNRTSLFGRLFTSAAAVFAALAVTPQTSAVAQQVALEEIVVTSRKRSESLLDIPVAVTAFTARDILEIGIADAYDLADFTPGLHFYGQGTQRNDRGATVFNIRGMTPTQSGGQVSTVFIDGAAIAFGRVQGLTDIERVEIIKGPQSAYFGRATFAGAINYITRAPGDEWRGQINAEAARFGTADISGTIEGPIVKDKLAVRLTSRLFTTDGQYVNSANANENLGAQKTTSIAATVYATPTDNFSAKLFVNLWRDEDGPGAQSLLNRADWNCDAGLGGGVNNYICGKLPNILDQPGRVGLNATVDRRFTQEFLENSLGLGTVFDESFIEGGGLKRHATQAVLSLDYEFNNGMSVSTITGYNDNKLQTISDQTQQDTSGIPNTLAAFIPNVRPFVNWLFRIDSLNEDFSQEFRLASDDQDRFSWMLGANYFWQKNQGSVGCDCPFGQLSFGGGDSRVETKSIFGSASYDITDQLVLNLEGRYQWDEITGGSLATGLDPNLNNTFKNFLPRVILDYKPTEDMTLYATFSRGSQPGGFNGFLLNESPEVVAQVEAITGAGLTFDEEELDNYELGFKGSFLDGRMQLSSAVYYAQWKNQIISDIVQAELPNMPGTFTILRPATNRGKTDLYGVELEVSYRATNNLTLSGQFALNDSEIKEFRCQTCEVDITGSTDVTGNRLPEVSNTNASASLAYRDNFSNDYEWFFRSDYIFKGSAWATPANLAKTGVTHRVNVRLGLESDNLRIEGYVTNLFDDKTYTTLERFFDLTTSSQPVRDNSFPVGLPDRRKWGVRTTYDF